MRSSSDVRVVIPARYQSQRLPGKPLIDLNGAPMIVRVFEAAKRAVPAATIVTAVDDDRVASVLQAHAIPYVMTAPEWPSGTDRVAEVARLCKWHSQDIVINVQGDEPLLPADLLTEFVRFCNALGDLKMATVSAPLADVTEIANPNVVKVVARSDGRAITFSRAPIPFDRDRSIASWDPRNYRRHVGLYGYRNDFLQYLTQQQPCEIELVEKLEQLRALWLGTPIDVLPWSSSPPGGVDTETDVERVRAALRSPWDTI